MAANYMLPPPAPLEIHDTQVAEKWKRFKSVWAHYSLATGLSEKTDPVQVATLLTVIGEEAREVFSTFTGWANVGDEAKITPVLGKFEEYCQPRKNIPFERYRFNRRTHEPGETHDQYRTTLRKIAENCDFASITPDEILRDRLFFGIRDTKTRERLLRESELTLKKTDEICHAAESTVAQMRVVEDGNFGVVISAVNDPKKKKQDAGPLTKQCQSCGRRHDLRRREFCPAFGKTCNKCNKGNHFAAKCLSKGNPVVHPLATEEPEDDEVFETHTVGSLDDSQLVTLRLASGSHIRFQVDTGAQCNVVPVGIYKRATQDRGLAQVTPSRMNITAYGGAMLPVVGTVLLRVWRGTFHCRLDCKLVDRDDICPLLGRKACLGMKIISYLDNDQLNQPHTGGAPVYARTEQSPLSVKRLAEKYPTVFGGGVGRLQGITIFEWTTQLLRSNLHLDWSLLLSTSHSNARLLI